MKWQKKFVEASNLVVNIHEIRERRLLMTKYLVEVIMEYSDISTANNVISNAPNASSIATSISTAASASTNLTVEATVAEPFAIRQDEICVWSRCQCSFGHQEVLQMTPLTGDGSLCFPVVGTTRACYCPTSSPTTSPTTALSGNSSSPTSLNNETLLPTLSIPSSTPSPTSDDYFEEWIDITIPSASIYWSMLVACLLIVCQ